MQWAVRGGCRALFESFGLGKTVQELEWCRIITERIGGKALIVLPLGVRQEFTRDAVQLLGWPNAPEYVRTQAEAEAAADRSGAPGESSDSLGCILMTNYERVRDGDIDPASFTACCLDEASVLRSFGSKTYQTFLQKFKSVPYKMVATATPSPNRYKELIHYAGYLGVMDTGQALTRFFQRDSTKAGNLTLYPHREREFWLWVSSWALFIAKPSDLDPSFDDTGYDLPPLKVRRHVIRADFKELPEEKDGQVKFMRDPAQSLSDAAREKNRSIAARVAKAAEIVAAANPDERFILWHDLEAERAAIEDTFPTHNYGYWQEYKDGNSAALALYERHYSAYRYKDGRERKLFCGPGEKLVLMTAKKDALFAWRKFIDDSGQTGVNCAVFRNESDILSSTLIEHAMRIAWRRWPFERLWQPRSIGERIKEVRKACRMSQAEVGEALGVTNTSVRNWEKGVCTPPSPTIIALAALFSCSVRDLTGISSPPSFEVPRPPDYRLLIEYTDTELLDELIRRRLSARSE